MIKKIDNTSELFKKLKINPSFLNNNQKKLLKNEGFLIFRSNQFLKKNILKFRREIDKLIDKEGDKGGWEGKKKYYKKGKLFEPGTNRLGNLIEKNILFSKLILMPEILASAKEVIQDDIKVCGLNYREPKFKQGNQKIHMDWKPRKSKKENFAGIVAMVFFDDTSKENGATRLIPGSHKKIGWPNKYININKRNKKEFIPNIKSGDFIVCNLNLWHAGAPNMNGARRRMIMINIKNRKFPQLLNYKKFLSIKSKKKLTNELKYLLAVRDEDLTQTSDSIGVGKYYKKDFHLNKNIGRKH